ncbi:calcium and integrin-binding protein 1-like isoform X2 [Hermetia illucens]|uniref:calcium and integrin-binding protein 1-like isoform X2 n=1 Tax=Hermetia illucens TaxID=343691 RepID=UPI0018CBF798|nr:calcium and integrin-binding protein 1-like isoform X2 [Hermetia illucens]
MLSSLEYRKYSWLSLFICYFYRIFNKFSTLGINEIEQDVNYRFPKNDVQNLFLELKYNPFCDRLFHVFSSQKDDCFSFEDFLDLCSVMSEHCPLSVKAAWGFKVFDFDEDEQITKPDIYQIVDKLTQPAQLLDIEKEHISDVVLKEMNIRHTGAMNQMEFLHAMTKMPEFSQIFAFKV